MPTLSRYTLKPVKLKSYTQQVLEAAYGMDIKELIPAVCASHSEKPNTHLVVAGVLGITVPTLHSWCHDLGIDIDSYRQCPSPDEAK